MRQSATTKRIQTTVMLDPEVRRMIRLRAIDSGLRYADIVNEVLRLGLKQPTTNGESPKPAA